MVSFVKTGTIGFCLFQVKKVLKNRIAQGIIGGGTTAYVMNKIAEGRRPVKIKKIKKK